MPMKNGGERRGGKKGREKVFIWCSLSAHQFGGVCLFAKSQPKYRVVDDQLIVETSKEEIIFPNSVFGHKDAVSQSSAVKGGKEDARSLTRRRSCKVAR